MIIESLDKEIKLIPITVNDIENLREWKNSYKDYFFNKNDITEEQQKIWYEKTYCADKNNYIFIIKYKSILVGTIGCRLILENWDIYNVMNVNKETLGKGIMSIALNLIIKYMRSIRNTNVTAKVLIGNTNLNWYIKNNFELIECVDNYNLIRYTK